MKILRVILTPFGIVYWGIISFRNYLYDVGQQRGVHFDVPTICVGNLAVGGTGKTPHVEYLISWLSSQRKICTLSRGYKRKSDGLVFGHEDSTAEDLGDEAFQVYSKFSDKINTAVCSDRVFGISMIAGERPETDLIILDDAFQHRAVRYDFNILISDFNKPFFNDRMMPIGDLRDVRKSARRAQAVIFSKCPELDEEVVIKYKEELSRYSDAQVFFTGLEYGTVLSTVTKVELQQQSKVVLLTGIANASYLKEKLEESHEVIKHFEFGDHHNFTEYDIKKVISFVSQNEEVKLVTTEKDYSRIQHRSDVEGLDVFVAPIKVCFLSREEEFKKLVLQHV